MGDRLLDDEWFDDGFDNGLNDGDDAVDEFAAIDPFEGLTKRDQDIFFKVLDIVPDDKREVAMDYFLDHPKKIKAVVAGVKLQKELLAEKDTAGLNQLFEEEQILFQNADNFE